MRPVTPKSYAEHGRRVLQNAIQHAQANEPDEPSYDSEFNELLEMVAANPLGDVTLGEDMSYDFMGDLERIEAIQLGEDE